MWMPVIPARDSTTILQFSKRKIQQLQFLSCSCNVYLLTASPGIQKSVWPVTKVMINEVIIWITFNWRFLRHFTGNLTITFVYGYTGQIRGRDYPRSDQGDFPVVIWRKSKQSTSRRMKSLIFNSLHLSTRLVNPFGLLAGHHLKNNNTKSLEKRWKKGCPTGNNHLNNPKHRETILKKRAWTSKWTN